MLNNAPPPPLNKRGSILGTGLSGLVGSRVAELLSGKYTFEDLSFDTGVDITNRDQVFEKISKSQANWILHLAAKTDVDSCEADKPLGKNGASWKINVEGTNNIVQAAKLQGKRVLYISTDFVFDGLKDFYTELDTPKPINWYGETKFAGEKLVLENPTNLVVRITYPYRAKNYFKKDFVHHMINMFRSGKQFSALTDHVISPTFIDDVADSLDLLMEKNCAGIYHVVGSTALTPYAAALNVAEVFGFNQNLVTKTIIEKYFKNRAPRPYKLVTKNDKIKKLGLSPKTFLDGLGIIKKQGVV